MSRDQQPCSTSVVLVVDRLSGRIDKDQLGCVSRNNNVMSDGLAKSGMQGQTRIGVRRDKMEEFMSLPFEEPAQSRRLCNRNLIGKL
ncbi:hypothetical protein V6N11_044814 [Hibiscus sabdariffa]|uniref:Uncharacterized protein n=2 Tax=Hibiscus sabdariffa TaxID=183260 RepID=A0ABR1ZP28_9ROSI